MSLAQTRSRPAISAAKYALLSRLAELLAKRVPHLLEMESGEAYLALSRALKDEIDQAFGGSMENLFILETYRRMAPLYSEFEPWHHAERTKPKAAVEYREACQCTHDPIEHAPVGENRDRVGRCLTCEACPAYRPGPPRAVPSIQALIYGSAKAGGDPR